MNDAPTIPGNAGEVVEQPPAAQNPAVLPREAEPIPAASPEPAPPIAPAPATGPATEPAKNAGQEFGDRRCAGDRPHRDQRCGDGRGNAGLVGIGVLLVISARPGGDAGRCAAYLKEFVTDKRVIEKDLAL